MRHISRTVRFSAVLFFVKSSAFGCSGDAMLHLDKAL